MPEIEKAENEMGDSATSHFYSISLTGDGSQYIQFVGSLLVSAADIAILVLNLFIQKDFDFQKLLDIENQGYLEQYMLLAPLISQLVQPAFILTAILLFFLDDVRALDKDLLKPLFWVLQTAVVVDFVGGNIPSFIMASIWEIFLVLSLVATAYFWFIPFLKDLINLLTMVVPLLGLTLAFRDQWEVGLNWCFETMTELFNLVASVQWQFPTSWQFWVLFSVLVILVGIPLAAVVSIVRIFVSIHLMASELWYLAAEQNYSGWFIFGLTSLIILPNIPASIAFLFTGLPLFLMAVNRDINNHLADALLVMAAVIGGAELLLNDIPLYALIIAMLAYAASILVDFDNQGVLLLNFLESLSHFAYESSAELLGMLWWKTLLMFLGVPIIQLGTFIVEEVYFANLGVQIGK